MYDKSVNLCKHQRFTVRQFWTDTVVASPYGQIYEVFFYSHQQRRAIFLSIYLGLEIILGHQFTLIKAQNNNHHLGDILV